VQRCRNIDPESVAREKESGKAYIHTHPDVYGRPAIVIQTSKHIIGERRCGPHHGSKLCFSHGLRAWWSLEGIDIMMAVFESARSWQ